jgi:hypothetical protein
VRNDRAREERITSELRQNYLTWLGTVLLLLLVGVSGLSTLAARSGLWADVHLATLSGALGGTLSGVIRLRIPESRLAALKNLGLVMLVQPLVGAVGGIVLFAASVADVSRPAPAKSGRELLDPARRRCAPRHGSPEPH